MQRPHPPIAIGGNGPTRTLRTVARFAQHWNSTAGVERVARDQRGARRALRRDRSRSRDHRAVGEPAVRRRRNRPARSPSRPPRSRRRAPTSSSWASPVPHTPGGARADRRRAAPARRLRRYLPGSAHRHQELRVVVRRPHQDRARPRRHRRRPRRVRQRRRLVDAPATTTTTAGTSAADGTRPELLRDVPEPVITIAYLLQDELDGLGYDVGQIDDGYVARVVRRAPEVPARARPARHRRVRPGDRGRAPHRDRAAVADDRARHPVGAHRARASTRARSTATTARRPIAAVTAVQQQAGITKYPGRSTRRRSPRWSTSGARRSCRRRRRRPRPGPTC